jgi:glucose/arabinose dehydrogenase
MSSNQVERFQLSLDESSATFDKLLIDQIPAGAFHNGGRIHFGPDGMLYVGTGDARNPSHSQDLNTPSGKLLRMTRDGAVPSDNPHPGNPTYLSGIRNLQAFDWLNSDTLILADHGPTGELGRTGHDEIDIARKGDNLGWPDIWGCEQASNQITPQWVWNEAVPPGGGAIYKGSQIPNWQGNFIIASLGAEALIRVILEPGPNPKVKDTEAYFDATSGNEFGRLREAIVGPDGEFYITTSNCDTRGICPSEKDMILKLKNIS